MPTSSQIGAKKEVTWNSPVVVDRFFEYESESIQGDYQRTESSPLRAGLTAQPVGRSVPWFGGAAGTVEIVPLSKGFGFWLEHMLGTIAAPVGPTDSAYTHTATAGELNGKSFTFQADRPFDPSGTSQAFTAAGGKITSWELSCAVEDLVKVSFDMDFASQVTATALATASYPTGVVDPFYWTKTALTIGGTPVPVESFSVKCDNMLKTDRRFLNNTTLKAQQTRADLREITFECEAQFADLSHYTRYAAATEAGATAAVVITMTGPTLIGATTYPSLTCTLPAVRFDGADPSVSDRDPLNQTLTGKALVHASNGLISLAYVSLDATP